MGNKKDGNLTPEQEAAVRWEAEKLVNAGTVPENLKKKKAELDREVKQGHPDGIRGKLSRIGVHEVFAPFIPAHIPHESEGIFKHLSQKEIDAERANPTAMPVSDSHNDLVHRAMLKQAAEVQGDISKFNKKATDAVAQEISKNPKKLAKAVEDYKDYQKSHLQDDGHGLSTSAMPKGSGQGKQ